MSGKRILDAVALLKASRSIASKHVGIRSHQLDVYTKTSSLGKAVKEQTDRVVLTARAAAALSARFNEPAPPQPNYTTNTPKPSRREESIPSRESVEGNHSSHAAGAIKGIDQEVFHEAAADNSAIDPTPTSDLHVKQEKAQHDALPDGTIPAHDRVAEKPINSDVYSDRPSSGLSEGVLEGDKTTDELQPAASDKTIIPTPRTEPRSADQRRAFQLQSEFQIPSDTAGSSGDGLSEKLREGHDLDSHSTPASSASQSPSSLPRMKIPKDVAAGQGGDAHLSSGGINSDVYYSNKKEEPEVTEEMMQNIFHSRKVASLLSGKPRFTRPPPKPVEKPSLDPGSTARSAKDISKFDQPEESQPNNSVDPEIAKLSADLAEDAASSASTETPAPEERSYKLLESKVPSSRLGRLWQYGGLATSMAFGAFGEGLRRVTGSGMEGGSLVLSPANIERLVAKLSRMRGAALKLGQMISFQGLYI